MKSFKLGHSYVGHAGKLMQGNDHPTPKHVGQKVSFAKRQLFLTLVSEPGDKGEADLQNDL
jgi:hypothetical protein